MTKSLKIQTQLEYFYPIHKEISKAYFIMIEDVSIAVWKSNNTHKLDKETRELKIKGYNLISIIKSSNDYFKRVGRDEDVIALEEISPRDQKTDIQFQVLREDIMKHKGLTRSQYFELLKWENDNRYVPKKNKTPCPFPEDAEEKQELQAAQVIAAPIPKETYPGPLSELSHG